MHARREERSTERPPSPTAPSRRRRTRLAAGAAALGIGIATALAPAAADELASTEPPVVEEATPSVDVDALDQISAEKARFAEAYEQHQRETLFFEVLQNQENERILAYYAALEDQAARAEAERAAAEAAANEAAAEAAEDEASSSGSPASTGPAPAGGPWQALAQCESGGNWSINTGNGYYGGLQFSLSTWQGHGGSGMPHEASAGEQIAVAQRVQASQGWGAWPSCSAKLGLR